MGERTSIHTWVDPDTNDDGSTAWDAYAFIHIPYANGPYWCAVDIEAGFKDEVSATAWAAQLEEVLNGCYFSWDNCEDQTTEIHQRRQAICDATNKRIAALEALIRKAYPTLPTELQQCADVILKAKETSIDADAHVFQSAQLL
jgi:hypothetical protein